MKIGIFGGSFNPPHFMHKNLALSLIEKKYVDKVIFVPVGSKYKKDHLVSDEHRLKMLELICEDNLSVSDFEMGGELKYTYQTLDYFQSIYPNDEIYFILGFDNLSYFHQWREFEYILNNYKLLVVSRGDYHEFPYLKEFMSNIIFTDVERNDISSNLIREELETKRYSDNIDKEVLKYILENDLYKEDLYECIFKRKSVRKFNDESLDKETLEKILKKVSEIKGIDSPKIECLISRGDEIKGIAVHKAPHYLVVTGEKSHKNMVEAGFILQKWSLWLNSIGIGNVWIGMANYPKRDDVLIVIAFGKTDDLFRDESEFKRKALSEIYNGKDKVFECARLAPSGINGQPWYFLEDDYVYVFEKKENIIKKAIYSLSPLDMGIVLANLEIGYSHFNREFKFEFGEFKKLNGYICIGRLV